MLAFSLLISLLCLGLVFGLVYALSPYVPAFCRKHGLVVDITERHLHKTPTPHGGGALLVAVVTPALFALTLFLQPVHSSFLYILFASSLLIALLGWLDDKSHQNQVLRLVVQVVCVSATAMWLPPLFDVVPVWLEKVILIFAWVWFVNLYNFMDGLDGLVTSQTVFIGMGIALLVPTLAPFTLVLAIGCLAFLRVNWQPAQVFLGDVGSTYLGFLVGGFLLLGVEWNTWELVWPLFTLPLVFSADTTYTLFKRMAQGHKPWTPHREFWTHRCVTLVGSHAAVVLRIHALNILLLLGIMCSLWAGVPWVSLFFGVGLLLVVARRIRNKLNDMKKREI